MKKRYLIKIYGIVQGVGFRPYVYKLAIKYQINGFIKNCGSFVLLDIEGKKENIHTFVYNIIRKPPALAKIEKVNAKILDSMEYTEFKIINSSISEEKMNFISPDVSICSKCIKDITNPHSRFHNYPFTNCTECGPRYSIIKSLPYDRINTTMEEFPFCEKCEDDYLNPSNRRFHAEPVACRKCGPKLQLVDNNNNNVEAEDIIKKSQQLIKEGYILAIKGIGGFHLCCDATNDEVVLRLRERKRREAKAFAIMAKDIETVKQVAEVNEVEEKVLVGREKPIVLLNKKECSFLSPNISINNKYLGVFLPYSPLLVLLFANLDLCVMTSGNISDEPIIYENNEALNKLQQVADYFLLNDRDIYMPQDDSVVQVVNDEVMILRLGRGYAPLYYKTNSTEEMISVGAEQKSSFCFSQNGYVFLSQYLGDLKNYDTYLFYQYCLEKDMNFFSLKPTTVLCDVNEAYLSSDYASSSSLPVEKIYHHHAHLISCMVEADLFEPVIGVIFDGSGLGDDDESWGGEFLLGNRFEFKRIGHLEYIRIQGLDSAKQNIWKIAYSYLYGLGLEDEFVNRNNYELEVVKKALDNYINCYQTSSIGRLFDCIACLIGVRDEVSFEGQAPLELESLIDENIKHSYKYFIRITDDGFIISIDDIIKGVIKDLKNKKSQSFISTSFHNTIVNIVLDCAVLIRSITLVNKVCLSGGVFQNRYLLTESIKGLESLEFNVYHNKKIPINDNGIACGQIFYKTKAKR